MPRSARIVLPGVPHHVTQRGNNRQRVFIHDDDYLQYLKLLKEYSITFHVAIHAYCLMPNHIHLVVMPSEENSLSQAIGEAHHKYSIYFNKKYNQSGHLWQNRFYSCPLDEPHYWKAMLYTERNPVRAKLILSAEQYKWSSAVAHLNRTDDFEILDKSSMNNFIQSDVWSEMLAVPEPENDILVIRNHTNSGLKLGKFDKK